MIQSTLLLFSRLHHTRMELFLVFGLDVTIEGTGLAECFIAVRTTVRLLVQMDSIDVPLEVAGSAE